MASSTISDNAPHPVNGKGNIGQSDIEKQATNESYAAPVAAPPKSLGAGVSIVEVHHERAADHERLRLQLASLEPL